ncbi:MAG TPA: BLUF domain-containing protein [Burkholderiales bacterium]|jgi:hypothetical protein
MENTQAVPAGERYSVALHAPAFLAPIAGFKGLVYAAEAATGFDAARLRSFAAARAALYERLDLTGHAYVHGSRVIEYIEGQVTAVDEAHAAIAADPLLTIRQSAETSGLPRRRFGEWKLQSGGPELADLRLEHVLEVVLQNLASALFGREPSLSAVWSLVDAVARRRAKAGKPAGARSGRLVFAH